jgi:Leucine-rich repeat (LRR) protein
MRYLRLPTTWACPLGGVGAILSHALSPRVPRAESPPRGGMNLTALGRRVLSNDELAEVLHRACDERWHALALVARGSTLWADTSLGQEWPPERIFLIASLPVERLHALTAIDSLRSLALVDLALAAEGAKALTSLPGLTSLNLERNRIGDEGAKALGSLTGLTSLNLESNRIGDEGAKALGSLTGLTSLNLESNRIGDESAKALGSLTGLLSRPLIFL